MKVFNEKQVDELIVLDIEASERGAGPDYGMIRSLATECRMPLCYGGGIKTVAQAEKVIAQGVEKIAISSAAVESPELVTKLARVLGKQSVVVVLDVRRREGDRYEVVLEHGNRPTGLDPVAFAADVAARGAGEIVINSVDNDGEMLGYDFELIAAVRGAVTVPITALGGAGSLKDIGALIAHFGVIGAAAGSLFVFKGIYRAVLISYPAPEIKERMIADAKTA